MVNGCRNSHTWTYSEMSNLRSINNVYRFHEYVSLKGLLCTFCPHPTLLHSNVAPPHLPPHYIGWKLRSTLIQCDIIMLASRQQTFYVRLIKHFMALRKLYRFLCPWKQPFTWLRPITINVIVYPQNEWIIKKTGGGGEVNWFWGDHNLPAKDAQFLENTFVSKHWYNPEFFWFISCIHFGSPRGYKI